MVNSKAKGSRGERDLCFELNSLYNVRARRSQQYCGAAGDADIVSDLPLHIECKFVERLNIYEAMAQAKADTKGPVPVVMHRKAGEKFLVTFELSELGRFADAVRFLAEGETKIGVVI